MKTTQKLVGICLAFFLGSILFSSYIFVPKTPSVLQEKKQSINPGAIQLGTAVPKQYLLSRKKIRASLGEDFAFDGIKFTVTSYRFVLVPKHGDAITINSKNEWITESMKNQIRKARKGDMVVVEQIRAKGPNGIVSLAPVIYTIM